MLKKNLTPLILILALLFFAVPLAAADLLPLDNKTQCEISGGPTGSTQCNSLSVNRTLYGYDDHWAAEKINHKDRPPENFSINSGRSRPGLANGPVDVWRVCRYVDNLSPATSILVPFNSPAEWDAFRTAALDPDNEISNFIKLTSCARPKNFTITPDNRCYLPSPMQQTGRMDYGRTGAVILESYAFGCVVPGLCNPQTGKCGAPNPWIQTVVMHYTARDAGSDRVSFEPDNPSNPSWDAANPIYVGDPPPPNPAPVDGQCGAANGGIFASRPDASQLCQSGVAGVVDGSGPWAWACEGLFGGDTVGCTAGFYQPPPPVHGACGGVNGTEMAIPPMVDLCQSGIESAIQGFGPWQWSCLGSNGGSDAQCEVRIAFVQPPDVDLCNGCQGGGDGGAGGGGAE